MKLGEVIESLRMIKATEGDLDLEVSIDMSVSGEEGTYGDRVFGDSPFLVRVTSEFLPDGTLHKYAQILFERGKDNREGE